MLTGYALTLAVPPMLWVLRERVFAVPLNKLSFLTVNFVCVYLLILVYAGLAEIFYDIQLDKYDLDGDGFFSEVEQTSEQVLAMGHVVNDTARNFAPIFGLVVAFLNSAVVGMFMLILAIKTMTCREDGDQSRINRD